MAHPNKCCRFCRDKCWLQALVGQAAISGRHIVSSTWIHRPGLADCVVSSVRCSPIHETFTQQGTL